MNNIEEIKEVEIQILSEVLRICQKLNIHVYADAGTLLGAIRHNGFIPWDDDIDLTMFRDDFNKFRKYAKKELNQSFFCQSGYNDKGFYGGMLHIRKNETTAILKKSYPYILYNQGIFIDIFPLDGIIENPFFFRIQTILKKVLNIIMWYKFYKKTVPFKFKHLLVVIPSLLPQKILFFLFEKICSIKNAKKSKYVDVISYFGTSGVGKRNTSWYESISLHPFNDVEIPIPNGYKEILEVMYGQDYMIPKQYSGDHGEIFFDAKHSYKEYLNGTRNIFEENR